MLIHTAARGTISNRSTVSGPVSIGPPDVDVSLDYMGVPMSFARNSEVY